MDRDEPGVMGQMGYVSGKRFEFVIDGARVHQTPRWEDDAPNPPLSARDAACIASELLQTLVPEADRWRFARVNLYPWGRQGWWVYAITFTGFLPPGVGDGAVPQIDIPVLMDGTVIEPIVSDYPPNV